MNIQEFRQKYPAYDGVSDKELSQRLWEKHYKDQGVDRTEFNQRFLGGGGVSEPRVRPSRPSLYDPEAGVEEPEVTLNREPYEFDPSLADFPAMGEDEEYGDEEYGDEEYEEAPMSRSEGVRELLGKYIDASSAPIRYGMRGGPLQFIPGVEEGYERIKELLPEYWVDPKKVGERARAKIEEGRPVEQERAKKAQAWFKKKGLDPEKTLRAVGPKALFEFAEGMATFPSQAVLGQREQVKGMLGVRDEESLTPTLTEIGAGFIEPYKKAWDEGSIDPILQHVAHNPLQAFIDLSIALSAFKGLVNVKDAISIRKKSTRALEDAAASDRPIEPGTLQERLVEVGVPPEQVAEATRLLDQIPAYKRRGDVRQEFGPRQALELDKSEGAVDLDLGPSPREPLPLVPKEGRLTELAGASQRTRKSIMQLAKESLEKKHEDFRKKAETRLAEPKEKRREPKVKTVGTDTGTPTEAPVSRIVDEALAPKKGVSEGARAVLRKAKPKPDVLVPEAKGVVPEAEVGAQKSSKLVPKPEELVSKPKKPRSPTKKEARGKVEKGMDKRGVERTVADLWVTEMREKILDRKLAGAPAKQVTGELWRERGKTPRYGNVGLKELSGAVEKFYEGVTGEVGQLTVEGKGKKAEVKGKPEPKPPKKPGPKGGGKAKPKREGKAPRGVVREEPLDLPGKKLSEVDGPGLLKAMKAMERKLKDTKGEVHWFTEPEGRKNEKVLSGRIKKLEGMGPEEWHRGKYDKAKAREIDDIAKKKVGVTTDPYEASFMLEDGSMLKMPGDLHAQIWFHVDPKVYRPWKSELDSVHSFQAATNSIRIKALKPVGSESGPVAAFELTGPPTTAQLNAIRRISKGHKVFADMMDPYKENLLGTFGMEPFNQETFARMVNEGFVDATPLAEAKGGGSFKGMMEEMEAGNKKKMEFRTGASKSVPIRDLKEVGKGVKEKLKDEKGEITFKKEQRDEINRILKGYNREWDGETVYRGGPFKSNVKGGRFFALDKEMADWYDGEAHGGNFKSKEYKLDGDANILILDLENPKSVKEFERVVGKELITDQYGLELEILEESIPTLKEAGYDAVFLAGETGAMIPGTPIELVVMDPGSIKVRGKSKVLDKLKSEEGAIKFNRMTEREKRYKRAMRNLRSAVKSDEKRMQKDMDETATAMSRNLGGLRNETKNAVEEALEMSPKEAKKRVREAMQEELWTAEPNSPNSEAALRYMKSEKFEDYVDSLPEMGELKPQDMKGKAGVADVRGSGQYVHTSFAEQFVDVWKDEKGVTHTKVKVKDIPKDWGHTLDPSRLIEWSDQKFGGELAKKLLRPARDTVRARLAWEYKWDEAIVDVVNKHGIKSMKDRRRLGRLMLGEEVNLPSRFHEAKAALDALYERGLNDMNAARARQKRKLVPKREDFGMPWAMEQTMRQKLWGEKALPKDIVEKGPAPDYIRPNQPFNPHELSRDAEYGAYIKEKDAIKIALEYGRSASRDIFNTNIIHNNRVHASWLKDIGLDNLANAISEWTTDVYAGRAHWLDRNLGQLGPVVHKALKVQRKLKNAKMRTIFPLNLPWNIGVQTTSTVMLLPRVGVRNSIRGLQVFVDPKLRKIVDQTYTHVMKGKTSPEVAAFKETVAEFRDLDKRGALDTVADRANFFTKWLEKHLTDHAIAAGYFEGLKRGLKGRDLLEFASDTGAKAHSMYNLEDLPAPLRSQALKSSFPLQTFAFEAMNNFREVTRGHGAYKGESKLLRTRRMLKWTAGMYAANQLTQAIMGKDSWTYMSFLPFGASLASLAGLEVPGGRYDSYRPMLIQWVVDVQRAARNAAYYDDWTATRQLINSWVTPMGTQLERVMSTEEARRQGGRVRKASGETQYKIPDDEYLRSYMTGPWKTTPGTKLRKSQEKIPLEKILGGVIPERTTNPRMKRKRREKLRERRNRE